MFTRHWIFFRFVLPPLAWGCAEIPHLLWPKSDLLLVLGVFFFLLSPLFNLMMAFAEQPWPEPKEQVKKFRRYVAVCLASEILALIVLAFTEVGATATFNDPHPDQWFDIVVVGALFFGPYTALVLLARNRLRRCYEILAEEMQNEELGIGGADSGADAEGTSGQSSI